MGVSSKEDILKKYAAKHSVSIRLLMQVFEEERANLHSAKPEIDYRRSRLKSIVEEWVDSHDN